jgi:hypothetical protein
MANCPQMLSTHYETKSTIKTTDVEIELPSKLNNQRRRYSVNTPNVGTGRVGTRCGCCGLRGHLGTTIGSCRHSRPNQRKLETTPCRFTRTSLPSCHCHASRRQQLFRHNRSACELRRRQTQVRPRHRVRGTVRDGRRTRVGNHAVELVGGSRICVLGNEMCPRSGVSVDRESSYSVNLVKNNSTLNLSVFRGFGVFLKLFGRKPRMGRQTLLTDETPTDILCV